MSLSAHRGEILHCLNDPDQGMDDCYQYLQDGLLILEHGHVLQCGPAKDLFANLDHTITVHHHKHGVIVPGFVDTHIHYPQCEVIASYGTQLIDWLQNYTFPAELQFSDEHTATNIAAFFVQELLRNGTTTALVFATSHPESVQAFFEEALKHELRMICGKVMMDRNAPKALCDTAESSYQQSSQLIQNWHGRGRLQYAVTPRFAPTSSARQLEVAGRLLQEHPSVYLHTHIAEHTDECEWVSQLFPENIDYLDVYDHYGLLGRRSVFAHGIHLSDREWQRLADTHSNIAFCPTSNLFIGSGLFDLNKAAQFGVTTGLGTDVGGGDSFSILRTINEAYKVQQLRGYNLSPMKSLFMATLGGAMALDLQDKIGNFETGKEADFVVLDYHATPLIQFRMAKAKSIMEKLFVLQMLGDDRAIRECWVFGKKRFQK